MKLKRIAMVFVALALVTAAPPALAGENGNVFSVYPEYPANQVAADAGYFYITAQPGETQTLKVNVANDVGSDIQLFVEAADAYTSPDGSLVYITDNAQASMGYSDNAYMMAARLQPSATSMTLRAGEKSPVSVTVTAPDIANSEFIGAIRFYTMSVGETEDSNNPSPGIVVNVKSAQTIPVRLLTGEPQSASKPDITIGEVQFDNEQSQFYLPVQNNLAQLSSLDSLSLSVTNASGKSVVTQELSPVKLAPKVNFRVYLDWTGDAAAPGDYSLLAACRYPDGEISEDRTFTVSQTESGAMPTPSAGSTAAASPGGGIFISTGAVVVVLLAVALVVLLVYLRYRRKKKRLMEAEKKESER